MFKFYNIPDTKTAESIIGKNPSIRFTSAFNLNDPFELKFNLIIDPNSKGQQEDFFKNFPNKSNNDFISWQKQVTPQFTWYTEQMQRAELSKAITIACFTTCNQNNLMWSHYANNHKGICVEYSKELLNHLKSINLYLADSLVKYSNKPPSVNSLETIESKAQKMLFNKQSEWEYEKEHRVILNSTNNTDDVHISNNLIKAVFIGSKCDITLANQIIEMCNLNGIKIYESSTVGKTYQVQFNEYKKGTITMKSFWN